MTIKITIIAAAAVLAAGYAQAQTADATKAGIDAAFEKMDTNKDGSVSREEFTAFSLEYMKAQTAAFDKAFAELDADKNGKISKEESAANTALEANFEQVDDNDDGFISKEELSAAMKAAQQAAGN